MKQKFRRVLSTLDDLAEVAMIRGLGLLRRRAGALMVGAAGLAAYLGSGFLLAPSGDLVTWAEVGYRPGELAPYSRVGWDGDAQTRARELLRAETWSPEDAAEARALVAAEAGPLDAAVATTREGPASLLRIPSYREIRVLTDALVLRARVEASRGSSPAATRDLRAALRVGRSMFGGTGGHRPLLIDGMIGVAIYGVGIDTAEKLLAAGALRTADLPPLRAELAAARASIPSTRELLEGDLAYFDAVVDGWAATNRLPGEEFGRLARLVLPLARADREAFGAGLKTHLRRTFEGLLEAEEEGRGHAYLQGLRPGFAQAFDALQAPFRRAAALRLVRSHLAWIGTPNMRAATRRIDQRRSALAGLELDLANRELRELRQRMF